MNATEAKQGKRPVTEPGGRRFLTAAEFEAARGGLNDGARVNVDMFDQLATNLNAVFDTAPLESMNEEDLGRMIVLAEDADSEGAQLIRWADQIRKRALDIYANQ